MNLLTRYILRQNLFLLLLVCGIGLGIYVFIDLFDRLDNFLEAGVGLSSVGAYFLYRTPFILAQIFPAVFLIALMVQMGLMLRSRELLALEACSVSPGAVAKSVIWYALALCVAQLFFPRRWASAGTGRRSGSGTRRCAIGRLKNGSCPTSGFAKAIASCIWGQ